MQENLHLNPIEVKPELILWSHFYDNLEKRHVRSAIRLTSMEERDSNGHRCVIITAELVLGGFHGQIQRTILWNGHVYDSYHLRGASSLYNRDNQELLELNIGLYFQDEVTDRIVEYFGKAPFSPTFKQTRGGILAKMSARVQEAIERVS